MMFLAVPMIPPAAMPTCAPGQLDPMQQPMVGGSTPQAWGTTCARSGMMMPMPGTSQCFQQNGDSLSSLYLPNYRSGEAYEQYVKDIMNAEGDERF
jgi:hypothetical protein